MEIDIADKRVKPLQDIVKKRLASIGTKEQLNSAVEAALHAEIEKLENQLASLAPRQ